MRIHFRITKQFFQSFFQLRSKQVFDGFCVFVHVVGCDVHIAGKVELPQPVNLHHTLRPVLSSFRKAPRTTGLNYISLPGKSV